MSKYEGEYKCPNCGNDILNYIVSQAEGPPSSDDFNYKKGFKFRLKNGLEKYTKGKWVGVITVNKKRYSSNTKLFRKRLAFM